MEQNLIKSEVESRIFTIRGMQVMLDSDLAELYGTETKFINRAVSRNQDRFPADFAFRLNDQEWSALFEVSLIPTVLKTVAELLTRAASA